MRKRRLLFIAAALQLVGCDRDGREIPRETTQSPSDTSWQAAPPSEHVPDAILAAAVKRALAGESWHASGVVSFVDGGIVTLRGSVPHLLAQRRIVDEVGALRGVRGVVDRLSVEAEPVADERLKSDIEAELAVHPAAKGSAIAVHVNDGRVLLTGTAESWAEREIAENIAAATRGARAIQNEIDVIWAEQRSDSEIAADVRARLRMDARLDAELVEARVEDGVVELTGSVGSYTEKTIAWRNAWVAGVERVDDTALDVRFTDRERMRRRIWPSDFEIEQALQRALRLDSRVGAHQPEVDVRGGVATITGSVDSVLAARAAVQDAYNTAGVTRVEEYLVVQPTEPPSDAVLETRVHAALRRDPYLFDRSISVDANRGNVRIAGTVDTTFERAQAERVAARIAGIRQIQNAVIATGERQPARTDHELEAVISEALYWSSRIDLAALEVVAQDGVVTLSGPVDSAIAMRTAVDAAYRAGARDVRNALYVSRRPD